MNFKEIKARQIKKNLFKLIADDWALICAGKENDFNMMTASWGTFGELWHRKIAIVFIRPQRYTHEFIEKSNIFSINFFNRDRTSASGTGFITMSGCAITEFSAPNPVEGVDEWSLTLVPTSVDALIQDSTMKYLPW